MSITSLSFTFVNTYASQSAKPAAAAERPAPAEQAETKSCGEQRSAPRQNRLVEAMMSALRELGFGNQAAAPATEAAPAAGSAPVAPSAQNNPAEAVTTNAATAAAAVADTAAATTVAATDSAEPAAATQAAAEPAVTVEAAVHQFAHELFRALRQVGRGESSEQDSNRIDGDGGRRQHHGHNGWRREGYGDMAQRLDALSQTFAAPAAVAATSGAQASAPVSTSISITLTIQDGQADPAANAVTTATPAAAAAVTAPTAESADAAQAATPAAATSTAQQVAKNPLLDAFSKLFSALKPQSAGAPQADMADKLRTFLQTLAQAVRPESMSSIQTPQVGGLVNVTA